LRRKARQEPRKRSRCRSVLGMSLCAN